MARKTLLTSELIDAICKRIRVGTYPYVAAAACGISKSTYYRWMQRAEEKRCPKIFRELKDKISKAAAAARSDAEVRVFRDRPFEWLRYGPGRERPGEPGWTETPQPVHVGSVVQVGGGVDHYHERQHYLPGTREQRAEAMGGALALLEELGYIRRVRPPALASPEDEKGGKEDGDQVNDNR